MLRVTITRVMMEPGATSQRHSHPESEQTWIVEQGSATLLLVDGKTEEIRAGDVVRTPAGEVHGVRPQGRDEDLVDVEAERLAVDWPVEEPWRLDPVVPQGGEERHRPPVMGWTPPDGIDVPRWWCLRTT